MLVSEIRDFEYIVTGSNMEALILECNLIKTHQPRFNVLLKDDKTYPYLKITNEEHPRLEVTRRVLKDKAKYFGPYPNAYAAQQTKSCWTGCIHCANVASCRKRYACITIWDNAWLHA